jgi:hypothetical protein
MVRLVLTEEKEMQELELMMSSPHHTSEVDRSLSCRTRSLRMVVDLLHLKNRVGERNLMFVFDMCAASFTHTEAEDRLVRACDHLRSWSKVGRRFRHGWEGTGDKKRIAQVKLSAQKLGSIFNSTAVESGQLAEFVAIALGDEKGGNLMKYLAPYSHGLTLATSDKQFTKDPESGLYLKEPKEIQALWDEGAHHLIALFGKEGVSNYLHDVISGRKIRASSSLLTASCRPFV